MKVKLLILFLLCCSCQGWKCGDKVVESGKVCDCSGEEITEDDYYDRDKECCPPPGPGHCEVTADDNDDYDYYDYYDDYNYHDMRGCPSHCEVTSEGDVKCQNSTVYRLYNQPCNGRCEGRDFPACPNANIIQGSGHQQCYYRNYTNDKTYDCLNRADEEQITLVDERGDIRDYSSVVPCETLIVGSWSEGLMCDEMCVPTYEWCNGNGWSCGNFTTTDAKLCQNYTFWNNKDCTRDNGGRVGGGTAMARDAPDL